MEGKEGKGEAAEDHTGVFQGGSPGFAFQQATEADDGGEDKEGETAFPHPALCAGVDLVKLVCGEEEDGGSNQNKDVLEENVIVGTGADLGVVLAELCCGDLARELGATEVVGTPAGGFVEDFEGIEGVAAAGHEAEDVADVVKIGPDGVPTGEGFGDAIDHFLALGLKGAKEAVPDDEGAAVVLVDVLGVDAVVDTVMGGGVEDKLKPAGELVDGFGMDPELVEGIELVDDDKNEGGESDDGEGQVKNPTGGTLESPLPEGHAEVVLLALVVDDMASPEEANLMGVSVKPVVEKVCADKTDEPDPPGVAFECKKAGVLVKLDVGNAQDGLKEGSEDLLAYTAGDVGKGIVETVELALAQFGDEELDPDEEEKDGNGQCDVVGGFLHRINNTKMAGLYGGGEGGIMG